MHIYKSKLVLGGINEQTFSNSSSNVYSWFATNLKKSNTHPQTPLDSFMKTTDSLRAFKELRSMVLWFWFFSENWIQWFSDSKVLNNWNYQFFKGFQIAGTGDSLILSFQRTRAMGSLRGFKFQLTGTGSQLVVLWFWFIGEQEPAVLWLWNIYLRKRKQGGSL